MCVALRLRETRALAVGVDLQQVGFEIGFRRRGQLAPHVGDVGEHLGQRRKAAVVQVRRTQPQPLEGRRVDPGESRAAALSRRRADGAHIVHPIVGKVRAGMTVRAAFAVENELPGVAPRGKRGRDGPQGSDNLELPLSTWRSIGWWSMV